MSTPVGDKTKTKDMRIAGVLSVFVVFSGCSKKFKIA